MTHEEYMKSGVTFFAKGVDKIRYRSFQQLTGGFQATESFRMRVNFFLKWSWPCFVRWVFPKIGVPPNHQFWIGFSIINHPFGVPLFLETPRWRKHRASVHSMPYFSHPRGPSQVERFFLGGVFSQNAPILEAPHFGQFFWVEKRFPITSFMK